MYVRGAALLELHAHNNSWHTMSPDETLKHLASNDIVASIQTTKQQINAAIARENLDKAQSDTNYARMATMDAGHINKLTPKYLSNATHETLAKELHDQEVEFFADDPLPDDAGDDIEAAERKPEDFPILQRMWQVHGKAYLRRFETLRDASKAGHRDIEIVNKSFNDMMCYPLIGRTTYRHCSLGDGCICTTEALRLGQPDIRYVGREYKTPRELTAWNERRSKGYPVTVDNDGPVGLCYHDIKKAVNQRLNSGTRGLGVYPEPANPFAVRVGKGEYATEVCWGAVDSNTNTPSGVTGRFPQFLTICLQYVTKTLPGQAQFTYLAEVNADFQPRLSQANMCLGTSSPLGMLSALCASIMG